MKTKVIKTHGMVDKDINKLKELQELMGVRAKNPFGASTVEELDEKMSDMNLVDLQRMAISAEIPASGHRHTLKEKIRREFERFMRGSHGLGLSMKGTSKALDRAGFEGNSAAAELMRQGI